MRTPQDTAGNAVRGPLNAWFFSTFDGYINQLTADRKRSLFRDLPDHVVEVGAGVGANFGFLKPGARVIAVEPNPHMLPGLKKRAAARGLALEILFRSAEDIRLPDNSVEAVICTLVLCTVPDPAAVLAEVRRILRPGGRFVFLEHVGAPERSLRRRLQELLHTPWHYLFEGCHTNRDTEAMIRSAGFARVDIDRYILRGPFIPVNTQIAGIATA